MTNFSLKYKKAKNRKVVQESTRKLLLYIRNQTRNLHAVISSRNLSTAVSRWISLLFATIICFSDLLISLANHTHHQSLGDLVILERHEYRYYLESRAAQSHPRIKLQVCKMKKIEEERIGNHYKSLNLSLQHKNFCLMFPI